MSRTMISPSLRRRNIRDDSPVSMKLSPHGTHHSPEKSSEDNMSNGSLDEDEVDDDEMDCENIGERKEGLYPSLQSIKFEGHAKFNTSGSKLGLSTTSATREYEEKDGSFSDSQNVPNRFGFLIKSICIVAVPVLVYYLYSGIGNNMPDHTESSKVVSEIVDTLKTKFRNQPSLSFRIIKSALAKVVASQNVSEPLAPAVLLLMSVRGAKDVTTCFAKQLANLVASGDKNYETILGENYKNENPVHAKKQIDQLIYGALQYKEHKVVLIESLDTIPSEAAMMLHSYCDDQNAPYKNAVFIMTIDADTDLSYNSESSQFDEAADAHLKKVWWDLDEDKLMPLLSRITVSVVAIYRSVQYSCT